MQLASKISRPPRLPVEHTTALVRNGVVGYHQRLGPGVCREQTHPLLGEVFAARDHNIEIRSTILSEAATVCHSITLVKTTRGTKTQNDHSTSGHPRKIIVVQLIDVSH